MNQNNFIFQNCLKQLNYIYKHYGESYVDELFDLLSDESSSNWKIAKRFSLSLVQVQFLRVNFKTLFRLSRFCRPGSMRQTSARIFDIAG